MAWLSLLIITILFHLNHRLNSDEGVTLNGAWNLINNRELYKDFIEFIPPGSLFLLYGVWKIFGVSFLSAQIVAILFIFFSALGLGGIYQLITNGKSNLLIPLSFIIFSNWWPIINHNTFNVAFLIWSCYFFIQGLDSYKKIDYFLSGLLVGVAIIFLHQKGLALLWAQIIFFLFLIIVKKQTKHLKSLLIFLSALIPPLLLLCFWPLKTIIYYLIKYPLVGYIGVNHMSFNNLYLSFASLFFCGILLMYLKEKSAKIWFLIFVQVFLLLTCYVLPDYFHISLITFPFFLVIFYLLSNFPQNISKYTLSIVLTIYLLSLLLEPYPISEITSRFVLVLLFVFFSCVRKINNYISGVVWVVFIVSILFINYERFLLSWVSLNKFRNETAEMNKSNCPGEYLYSGPMMPEMYFETRKINATPHSVLITNLQTSDQFVEALNGIKHFNPSCAVLYYPKSLSRFKHNTNNLVENYIRENYLLFDEPIKDLFFYKKKPD